MNGKAKTIKVEFLTSRDTSSRDSLLTKLIFCYTLGVKEVNFDSAELSPERILVSVSTVTNPIVEARSKNNK